MIPDIPDYTPPPDLIHDLLEFGGVETLTHAGEQKRHLNCAGRDPGACRPACTYCLFAHKLTVAEFIAHSSFLYLATPVCINCAFLIRTAIEERVSMRRQPLGSPEVWKTHL